MAWHKEGRVEDYLVKRVKATGGHARKLQWIGRSGAPDRFVWWPGGVMAFVECKAPGEPLKGPQVPEIRLMQESGLPVYVIDTVEGVDRLIMELGK